MIRTLVLAACLLMLPATAFGADETFEFGGDRYATGAQPSISAPVQHDAFMAGNNVSLSGPVGGSAHLFGMDVTSGGRVEGDLYAAGFSVGIAAPVAGSVSAAGNSVSVRAPGSIGGNARLAGASVSIAGPVSGSTLVTARTLDLDAAIDQDLRFFGENITFGPNAKVNGTLSIHAPKPISVPATVAPAERVQFTETATPNYASEAGSAATGIVGSFLPILWAAITAWLVLFLVGIGFIALAPRVVDAVDAASSRRPFRNFGLGILTFASVLGLVPVAVMTLVGIPLLPLVLLFIFLACLIGYLAGVFYLGLRIASGLTRVEGSGARIAVLAASLLVAALIGLVPILNWLVGLVLLIFGLGIIAVAVMDGWAARDAARRPGEAAPIAPGAPG